MMPVFFPRVNFCKVIKVGMLICLNDVMKYSLPGKS